MTTENWNGFEIAEYLDDDFEAVARLFRQVFAETYPHFDAKFFEPERFRKILSEHILPNAKIWTAKKDGKLAGFLALEENFIDQLYIYAEFQNRGLGGFFVEQSKKIFPDFLELYTFDSNENAVAFYEKHDFKIIERGIAPDEKMPDVKMQWKSAGVIFHKTHLRLN